MPSAWTARLARVRVPHVFPLLLGVILACALLTYAIPAGEYERREVRVGATTRTIVVPGTYRRLPKEISIGRALAGRGGGERPAPASLVQLVTAVPRGMAAAADIIFLIFIVGGLFGILQRAGTIAAVIHALLARFAGSGPLLTAVLMMAVGIGGSTLGMGEEFVALVPVFLMVSREMGRDRVFGVALVYLGGAVGFAAATTNPFTVQIAQGIAGVPIGSGIGFRLVFFLAAMLAAIVHVERYGRRVRTDPSRSLAADEDGAPAAADVAPVPLTGAHVAIVLSAAAIFAGALYAIQAHGWWLDELSGAFLLIAILAAALAGLGVADATAAFVKGLEEMTVPALVIGFAKGIQIVLDDARVLDTIVHAAAQSMQALPTAAAAQGMLLFQTALNFFIPSGSGQAAVTMPLMAPLADVLGMTRQSAVFAFTCGDGFSNMIIPTSGLLMASLGIARVPYERWLRFVMPLFLQLFALSAGFLAVAVWMGY